MVALKCYGVTGIECFKLAMWYVYIIEKNKKLYTGITADLPNRLRQHDNPKVVYYDVFNDKYAAARKEKKIKGWNKNKKLNMANLKGEFTLNEMK